jgi:IS30 family transposase
MKYKQLNSEQRYAISLLLRQGKENKEIAEAIGVNQSTVWRERHRNSLKRGGYSSDFAQELAAERKCRQPGNRAVPESVKRRAVRLLSEKQWSPQQISGRLALSGDRISHETIYSIVRKDKLDGGTLYRNCRHRLKHRKRPVGRTAHIPNRVSIHERPIEADGSRFGDFEMDTIIGKDNSGAIVTITERKTNYLMMRRLTAGKNAKELAKNVVAMLLPYRHFLRTITTDNGSEFADHDFISKKLGVPIFFADPYSSWQKGAIENANKLVRQYIPKNTVFSSLDDDFIRAVQFKINDRPRAKLNFYSPKKLFFLSL